ncbi:hypothetical protein DESC_610070 [Desulfosarcina cetonica]|nr:hypothetical protein DESC_610070 [Desulfosarcina cetonica]
MLIWRGKKRQAWPTAGEERSARMPAVDASGLAQAFFGQGSDQVDIILVHETAAGLNGQAGEAEFFGQDDLQYRQVTLEIGLAVAHQIHVTVLDGADRGRGHAEPGAENCVRPDPRGTEEILQLGGQGAMIHDDQLAVRVGR